MQEEQLVGPVRDRRVREVSFCCGQLRRHRNERLDIFCLKELDADFVYMTLFISTITFCITLYAFT